MKSSIDLIQNNQIETIAALRELEPHAKHARAHAKSTSRLVPRRATPDSRSVRILSHMRVSLPFHHCQSVSSLVESESAALTQLGGKQKRSFESMNRGIGLCTSSPSDCLLSRDPSSVRSGVQSLAEWLKAVDSLLPKQSGLCQSNVQIVWANTFQIGKALPEVEVECILRGDRTDYVQAAHECKHDTSAMIVILCTLSV